MKVGRDYSWWVEIEWEFEYKDSETGKWEHYYEPDARRFNCLKKDIRKEAIKYVKEYEIADDEEYRNLSVKIKDAYMTTPEEI